MNFAVYRLASAIYWLPRLEAARFQTEGFVEPQPLSMPLTEIVPWNTAWAWGMLSSENPEHLDKVDDGKLKIIAAANRIGYPVFVRGDNASAKHEGPRAYRMDGPEDIDSIVVRTSEDSLLKDLGLEAFLIRKHLDLSHHFTAHHGLPIATERRVFASRDRVWCDHFYWPEGSVLFYKRDGTPPDDWQDLMKEQASIPITSRVIVEAIEATRALHHEEAESWSIDFALDTDGKWWLIDVAPAALSWHPDCPFQEQLSPPRTFVIGRDGASESDTINVDLSIPDLLEDIE